MNASIKITGGTEFYTLTGTRWRCLRRLTLYTLWTFICIPIHLVLLRLPGQAKAFFPTFYHRVCLRFFGIKIKVKGQKTKTHPVLFVANHSSYLDIPVLGALIPGSFIAKAEVNEWPFFGMLARLQRTVFVERQQNHKINHQKESLLSRLQAGDALILFAEGTSSDGNRTLPFKSALFAAATAEQGRSFVVQPVSITPVALDGIPLGWSWRSVYSWLGADSTLPQHFLRMAGLGRMIVVVEFHPPVTLEQFGHRKLLANHCWTAVSDGVSRAVAGRPHK